jgi:hypothetical protein
MTGPPAISARPMPVPQTIGGLAIPVGRALMW